MASGRVGGVPGWIVGLVCIAAIVACATAWSAVRRAEQAEGRIATLQRVIGQKDRTIRELQEATESGETGDSEEVGADGE